MSNRYKCTECGAMYDEKPDYCDCGNNVFEEMLNKELKERAQEEGLVVEKSEQKKKSATVFKPVSFQQFDIFSVSFFILCIILSILAWVFIGKEDPNKPKVTKDKVKTEKKIRNDIPDINSIWDSTLPTKPDTEYNKPAENPVKKKPESPATVIIPPQKTVPAPIKQAQTVNKPKSVQNSPKPTPAPAKKVQNQDYSEIIKYKTNLRQTLFSHLAVGSVAGSGKCGIEFSISPSGQLLDRDFTYQSRNDSLNDAVYKMLMSMPRFYPPPSGYKGEKIKMSIYIDNGYYEINYVN